MLSLYVMCLFFSAARTSFILRKVMCIWQTQYCNYGHFVNEQNKLINICTAVSEGIPYMPKSIFIHNINKKYKQKAKQFIVFFCLSISLSVHIICTRITQKLQHEIESFHQCITRSLNLKAFYCMKKSYLDNFNLMLN